MAEKVQAAHLLVKHSGSRRPSSWKENNITRSKEEALAKLEGFKRQIEAQAGGDPAKLKTAFMNLARTESDCSSHSQGGDLGFFGHGEMQWAFEEAAFGLKVGEMCGPVDTESGVHLILRLA